MFGGNLFFDWWWGNIWWNETQPSWINHLTDARTTAASLHPWINCTFFSSSSEIQTWLTHHLNIHFAVNLLDMSIRLSNLVFRKFPPANGGQSKHGNKALLNPWPSPPAASCWLLRQCMPIHSETACSKSLSSRWYFQPKCNKHVGDEKMPKKKPLTCLHVWINGYFTWLYFDS